MPRDETKVWIVCLACSAHDCHYCHSPAMLFFRLFVVDLLLGVLLKEKRYFCAGWFCCLKCLGVAAQSFAARANLCQYAYASACNGVLCVT